MSSEYLFWGCLLGELGLVYFISSRIMNLSLTTATLLFIAYSILNGVTMSFIFLVYTTSSIANVFFITAGTFGAMSLIGYTTKRDLSKMGQLLMMALVGLIIASFANILMKNDTLSLIISYVGVVVFVGLTAWDTQKIKRMLAQADDISEDAQKIALLGALTLYLDFVNLFLYLLRLLGKRN
jgi:membrane protein